MKKNYLNGKVNGKMLIVMMIFVKRRCTEFKSKNTSYQKTFGVNNKYINCPATEDPNKCGIKKKL